MSGYTNFAIVGAGVIGSYIVAQLLKDKDSGIVKDVVVLTRQVCEFIQHLDCTRYAEQVTLIASEN
jgi:ketopantoate reductase